MKKLPLKDRILPRLQEALEDLYHNGTPRNYSILDTEQSWELFQDLASQEMDYIREGLGLTQDDWKKAVKLGFTHNERYFWLVQRITEYGKLYSWGRGGRTIAPDQLIRQKGGGSFSIKGNSEFNFLSNADIVDMIQVIEAFNKYVRDWNSSENIKAMMEQCLEDLQEAA